MCVCVCMYVCMCVCKTYIFHVDKSKFQYDFF